MQRTLQVDYQGEENWETGAWLGCTGGYKCKQAEQDLGSGFGNKEGREFGEVEREKKNGRWKAGGSHQVREVNDGEKDVGKNVHIYVQIEQASGNGVDNEEFYQ